MCYQDLPIKVSFSKTFPHPPPLWLCWAAIGILLNPESGPESPLHQAFLWQAQQSPEAHFGPRACLPHLCLSAHISLPAAAHTGPLVPQPTPHPALGLNVTSERHSRTTCLQHHPLSPNTAVLGNLEHHPPSVTCLWVYLPVLPQWKVTLPTPFLSFGGDMTRTTHGA